MPRAQQHRAITADLPEADRGRYRFAVAERLYTTYDSSSGTTDQSAEGADEPGPTSQSVPTEKGGQSPGTDQQPDAREPDEPTR